MALLPLGAAEIPRKAPELAVQLLNGRQVLLSELRGKVVLLEFLHTTCPHCQQDSALIEQLYKELGPRGFQPVGVAFNENAPQLLPDFVRQLGLSYTIGIAPRDTVIQYLQHPLGKPLYVPQMMFVDRKGMIRAQHGGDDDFLKNLAPNLRAQLETLLKEPAGPQRSRTARPRSAAAPTRASK
jgi:peroxiredoxin